METVVLSNSRLDDLWHYRKGRFRARVYLPLAFVLVAAGNMGTTGSIRFWTGRLILACSLLFQFRLWDDLADRAHDAHDHPDRVLIQTTHLHFFVGLVVLMGLLNTASFCLEGSFARVGAFLALQAAFLCWYPWLRHCFPGPITGYHVTLMKYPVFVYLLGPLEASPFFSLLAGATGVYLCLCIYEALHDARIAALHGARICLALELLALGGVAILLTLHLSSPLWSES
jgi:hypothetical protein